MPITTMRGNIVESGADVILDPVNCVGVAGAGLALQFKNRYPGLHSHYRTCCAGKRPQMRIDHPGWWLMNKNPYRYIVLFPTKRHWRDLSSLADIETTLDAFFVQLSYMKQMNHISTVAIPKLGCGLGGLSWADVRRMIVARTGKHLDITFALYE